MEMGSGNAADPKFHVVMFPWFALGHIVPFAQLSNNLSAHNIKISFLSAPGNIPRIKSLLTPTHSTQIQIIPLPIPHVDGLPSDLDNTSQMTPFMAELLKQAVDLMQPQIKTLLSTLKPHFILHDFTHQWLPALVSELGIKSKTMFFSVFSALVLAYILPPRLDTDLQKPPPGFPSLTSLKPFEAQNLSYAFKSFNGCPTAYDRFMAAIAGSTAIVIKTSNEMESVYVNFLRTQFGKPFFLTGPLVNVDEHQPPSGVLEDRWDKWLCQFPAKSVIYCSFGSETFLKEDEVKELALGLELTDLPFFLVLNFPANLDAVAEMNRVLPEGFLERVKHKGVVHTGWVQQQLILGHNSVGCYLCHSGFSSVIEGLVNDCQLALLPFKLDQFFNAKLFGGEMKAGVEVDRRGDDGYFGKENILEAIKTVMVEVDKEPGTSIRANQKKWREFLMNAETHKKYISDLVKEMEAMA